MSKTASLVACVVGFAGLSACANGPEIRDLAGRTAAAATHYSTATKAFAQNQAEVANLDQSRLENVRLSAMEFKRPTDALMREWTLAGDKKKIERFKLATAKRPADFETSLAAPATAAPVRRSGVDLAEPVKTLQGIAKEPSLLSHALTLGEYAGAVQAEVEELRKEAEKKAKDAAQKAADEQLPGTAEQ